MIRAFCLYDETRFFERVRVEVVVERTALLEEVELNRISRTKKLRNTETCFSPESDVGRKDV